MPFLLKDGDIIGVRQESENPDGIDDFQTEEDRVAKEAFNIQKELEQKFKEENKDNSKKGKKNAEQNLVFNVGF
jgi:hypothetical protein